ncbi:MAG: PAS domain S-box protein [Bacteroidetes bacterium]|nr:PAS domain S-box protein [Bacteroidota bacterium]
MVVFCKNILSDMISMFEKAAPNNTQKYLLQTKLDNCKIQYEFAKTHYYSILKDFEDTAAVELLPIVKKFFFQSDSLVQQITTVPAVQAEKKIDYNYSEILSARSRYDAIISGSYNDLRQGEQQVIKNRAKFKTEVIQEYFILLFICTALFGCFSIILALVLFFRDKNSISESSRSTALIEASINPTLLTDKRGTVKHANPAFIRWSGREMSSFAGRNLFELTNTLDRQEQAKNQWKLVEQTIAENESWSGEVELECPGERTIISSLVLTPILDKNGNISECIAQYKDSTEKRELTRKIVETQEEYRGIVESSLDGIMIIQEGKLVFANPSSVRLFGHAKSEDMQKLKLSDTFAPSNRASLEFIEEGRTLGDEVLRNSEMRGLTKQGRIIDLEVNAHIIEWNGHSAVQVSLRDITKRKMLEREQSLWLWEQETLSNIDRKLVGIMDLDKVFSAILQQTLNLTRAHFAGVLLFEEKQPLVRWKAICGNTLTHELNSFKPNEAFDAVLKNERPSIVNESNASEFFLLSQIPIIEEEKIISTAWMPLVVEGRHKGMIVVGYRHNHEFVGREMRLIHSLAEKHSIAMVNAQLYADLLQREKELEILSGASVQAQEEERRRIAREIHDGLGQMLTAIKFNLEILEDMITVEREGEERIKDMKSLLDDVMKEAREISFNLMPSVLDDFGLTPALQLLSEQFMNRTSIKTHFHSSGITERLDPQVEIGLYRIAQESLNNVAKHAEATEVNLQFIRYSEGIRLVIEDNGKGITERPDIVRATGKGGMGLVSMRERAASLGGVLTIDSTPKSGTFITVEIPMAKTVKHE